MHHQFALLNTATFGLFNPPAQRASGVRARLCLTGCLWLILATQIDSTKTPLFPLTRAFFAPAHLVLVHPSPTGPLHSFVEAFALPRPGTSSNGLIRLRQTHADHCRHNFVEGAVIHSTSKLAPLVPPSNMASAVDEVDSDLSGPLLATTTLTMFVVKARQVGSYGQPIGDIAVVRRSPAQLCYLPKVAYLC
jgi:hypothetical protein